VEITREEVQNKSLLLSDNHKQLVLELATGVGKTLIAINIIERHGGFWNIVIAELTHELNWIKEFKKHDKENLLPNVKFFCYASLKNNLDGDNYIMDEFHHIASDKRIEFLSTIKANGLRRMVGLSATLTDTQKSKIEAVIGKSYIYRFNLSDAIDSGILPEPIVYFIEISLDDKYKYIKFNFNKEKFMICTEVEYYQKLTERVDYLKDKYFESRDAFAKNRWMQAATIRKRWLCSMKTKEAEILINKLQNKRFVCFTGSIEQSESLSSGRSIHSKIGKKKVEQIIENFNSGEIDGIFATGMLKEGINLDNIEAGIIIQLDNTERYFTQIHGRTLRSSYPEQYVMYVKNTQDEIYCKTALNDFNMDYVKFVTIKDI